MTDKPKADQQTFTLDNQTYDFAILPDSTKQIVVNLTKTDSSLERHQQEIDVMLIAREQLISQLKQALADVPTIND